MIKDFRVNSETTSIKRRRRGNGGQAMVTVAILFLAGSIVVIGSLANPVLREVKAARTLELSKRSYAVSESVVEDAVYRLVNALTISSEEVLIVDGVTATATIDTVGSNIDITAEGDATSYIRKIKVGLITNVTGVSFFYGAQVGEGGLEMDENSRIEGVGGAVGNVYSNGPIVGESGATITGDAIVATGITEDVQARSLVCNQDQIVGQEDPQIDFAQSFKPGATAPLAKVSVYIKKVGSPNSRKLKIVADNGGSPDTVKITEGTLDKNLVGTGYGWIDIVFPTPATLTSGTTYWLVLDAKTDTNKYWIWCSDSNNGFGNGVAKYSEDWDDDPWTQITGDLTFKTYSGAGISSISDVTIDGTAKANAITDSTIGGDAYFQTILNTDVTGIEYPGSSDPPVLNLPLSDANILDWKADAVAGGTLVGNCGDSGGNPNCFIDNDATLLLGPKKIEGDLIMSNNQTLILTGVVHFTGNVDIQNNIDIECSSSFGDDSCVLIADGWIHVQNNVAFAGSGDPNSFIMILTTLAGCNGSGVGCTHEDGAIDLHNNSGGAIFYASESMINLHNNVNITSAVGYKLRLDNNSTISYETGVNNGAFSSGPSGGWSVDTWTEVE